MNPGIQMLELAIGIKDVLVDAGFTTIDSLVRMSPAEIAAILGIEFYVGKIIIDAAKRAAAQAEGPESRSRAIHPPRVVAITTD
jgi:hypothetical protein